VPQATRVENGGERPEPVNRRGLDWIALGVLAVLVLAFFWRAVLLGEVLLPSDILTSGLEPWMSELPQEESGPVWNTHAGDAVTQHYPEAVASIRAWRHGLPLWDPTVLTGMPGWASGREWSNPIVIGLGGVLPADRVLTIATIVSLLIGAVSCLLLFRELGCGRVGALAGTLVFTFNPYAVGWFSHATIIATWVWIPLVFLGFEAAQRRSDRRWLLLGGLAFALQILSGFVLLAFYTGATLGIYATVLSGARLLSRRAVRPALSPVADAAAIGAVGLGLSAPMWFLTAELFERSERVGDIFAGFFMPLVQSARVVVPYLWGLPLHGEGYSVFHNPVETTLSVGATGLVLAVAAVAARGRRRVLVVTAIGIFALFALFGIPPASRIMEALNPTFFKTFPGRVFYVTAFGLALAAGIGADWLDRERPRRLLRFLAGGALATASVLLTGAAAVQLHGGPGGFASTGLPATLLDLRTAPGRGVVLAATVLVAAAVVLWAWSGDRRRRWPGPALIVVTTVELFALGIRVNPSFPRSMTFPRTPGIDALCELMEREGEPTRMVGVPTIVELPGQMPMVWDLQAPTGYCSWLLRRYAAYARLIPGKSGGEIEVYLTDCCHPLVDALNVRWVIAPADFELAGATGIRLDQRLWAARSWSHFPNGISLDTWVVDGRKRQAIFTSGPTAITYRLRIPPAARLVTAAGLKPDAWEHSDGMTFWVSLVGQSGADSAPLFATHLDPKKRPSDRRYVPVEVDLSELAGEIVELRLATGPGPAGDLTCDWGGWIEPIIVNGGEPSLELVADGPNRIYRNRDALPRAWLVRRAVEVASGDLEAVQEVLRSGSFDPGIEAVVEGSLGATLGTEDPDDNVTITTYGSDCVELDVRAAEPALLVLSDMIYPGWRAFVDGVERPILATNLIMRGVVVDGVNHVVFEYRPGRLVLGLWVSALTAVVVVIVFAFETRRRMTVRPERVRGRSSDR
jgi:hypothetical protein